MVFLAPRALQSGETSSMKVLRQEHTKYVWRTARKPLFPKTGEQGRDER